MAADVADAEVVIHATTESDEVLFRAAPARRWSSSRTPILRRLAPPAKPAQRVVGGLDVLVAQGAASFELWTGVPRPLTSCARSSSA